jgi:hypothetical protein
LGILLGMAAPGIDYAPGAPHWREVFGGWWCVGWDDDLSLSSRGRASQHSGTYTVVGMNLVWDLGVAVVVHLAQLTGTRLEVAATRLTMTATSGPAVPARLKGNYLSEMH